MAPEDLLAEEQPVVVGPGRKFVELKVAAVVGNQGSQAEVGSRPY